jgi:tRNA 2-thiouridine synthesizing protein A
MKEVDARGLSCPEPVMLLADALKGQDKEILLLVDDFAPIENCTRYAENHGCQVKRQDKEDYTELHISR